MATTQTRIDYLAQVMCWIEKQRKTPTWAQIEKRFPVACGLATGNGSIASRAIFGAVIVAMRRDEKKYKQALRRLETTVGAVNAASGTCAGRRPLVFDVSGLL